MKEAYGQFVHGKTNLIAVCSDWFDDSEDFETALLGRTFERLAGDKRMTPETGRLHDGFWSVEKHRAIELAIFFTFSGTRDHLDSRWVRDHSTIAPELISCVSSVFTSTSVTR